MDIKKRRFARKSTWLAHRKNFINSTEVAALLGAGKWNSYFSLWHMKNGTLEDTFKENKNTKAGEFFEATIGKYFNKEYDCVSKNYKFYHYNERYRIGSSYDNLISDGKYKNCILEIKNLNSFATRTWENDELPLHIQLQTQEQLLLMPEAQKVIVCALVDGWNLKIYEVERHDSIAEIIKTESLKFWASIEAGQEPPMQEIGDFKLTTMMNFQNDGHTIEADENLESLILQFYKRNEMLKTLKDQVEVLKGQIIHQVKAEKVTLSDGRYLDLGTTKGRKGQEVTQEMVGQVIGGTRDFRRCTLRGKIKDEQNKLDFSPAISH